MNRSDETKPRWSRLVHQDIKPDNIVLGKAGTDFPAFKRLILIDFGIAAEAVTPHSGQGTGGYVAPVCLPSWSSLMED